MKYISKGEEGRAEESESYGFREWKWWGWRDGEMIKKLMADHISIEELSKVDFSTPEGLASIT